MEKKLAFSLEINNTGELKALERVDVALTKVGKELRTTKKEIQEYNDATEEQRKELDKTGKSADVLSAKYAKQKGEQFELKAENLKLNTVLRQTAKDFDRIKDGIPDDSLIGLRRTYEKLRREIDRTSLTALELPENLDKIAKANNVKEQIDKIGASVGDFRSQVGSYEQAIKSVLGTIGNGKVAGIVDPIANILGSSGGDGGFDVSGIASGIGGALTGLPIGDIAKALGPAGAVATAAAAGSAAIITSVISVTKEYEKLFDTVADVTNLDGLELVDTTAQIKSLAEVFDGDFNEILFASNALVKSFGEENVTFADSLDLIKLGFIASAGANDNFLDQLQEYSIQAKETGLSQEQLLEVLIRSTQEGIFSDKGIDLIKEGGLRIREQTEATKTALENAFGSEFTERILKGVEDGSLTSFEALQEVSKGLDDFGVTVQERQELIADLFAGPGEDGTKLIEIIKNVDGNLDNLIDTTGAYTQRQLAQLDITQRLNTAQAKIAANFAGTGTELELLGKRTKTFFVEQFADAVLGVEGLVRAFREDGFSGLAGDLLSEEDRLNRVREVEIENSEKLTAQRKKAREDAEAGIAGVDNLRNAQARLTKEIQEAKLIGEDYTDLQVRLTRVNEKLAKITEKTAEATEDAKPAIGSIAQLSEEVSKLDKALKDASPENVEAITKSLIEAKDKLQSAQDVVDALLKPAETDDERIKREQEAIEVLGEIRKAAAIATIEDEKALNIELDKIKQETLAESLTKGLEGLEEGTKAYLVQLAKINKANAEVEDINVKVILSQADNQVDSATSFATQIAESVSDSEEELETRLEVIRLEGLSKKLENRLEFEQLSADEEEKIRVQLEENIRELERETALLTVEFADKSIEIERERLDRLAELKNEGDGLDSTDEDDVARFAEIENEKKEIELEIARDKLELDLELLKERGEATLDIEAEIAEREIEINALKNKKILDAEKAKAAAQKKVQDQILKVGEDSAEALGEAFSGFVDGSIGSLEEFAAVSKNILIDGVRDSISLLAVEIIGKAVAQLGPIIGPVVGAGAVAIVNGLLNVALGGLRSGEEGMIVGFNAKGTGSGQKIKRNVGDIKSSQSQDLKKGTIFKGRNHTEGGEHYFFTDSTGRMRINEGERDEAIIKATSTRKWTGLLSAINEDTGGAQFSADSGKWKKLLSEVSMYQDGGTNDIIATPPQLVNPSQPLVRLSEGNISQLSQGISLPIAEVMDSRIPLIVEQVIVGLSNRDKLDQRLKSAELESER